MISHEKGYNMLQESALSSLLTILPKWQVFIDKSSRISYEADGGVDKVCQMALLFRVPVKSLCAWYAGRQKSISP